MSKNEEIKASDVLQGEAGTHEQKRVRSGNTTSFKPGNAAASKYRERYADELVEYIEKAFDEALDAEKNSVKKESYYQSGELKSSEPVFLPVKYPSLARFARTLGVTPKTLIHWAESHDRFSIAYAYAKELLEALTVEGAITGRYDTNFAKFVLANFHGVKDESETNITVKQVPVDLPTEIDEECY